GEEGAGGAKPGQPHSLQLRRRDPKAVRHCRQINTSIVATWRRHLFPSPRKRGRGKHEARLIVVGYERARAFPLLSSRSSEAGLQSSVTQDAYASPQSSPWSWPGRTKCLGI